MFISVINGAAQMPGADVTLAAMAWRPHAQIGEHHPAGKVIAAHDLTGRDLVFVLSRTALSGPGVMICRACDAARNPAIFRIDEVCFPVGAIAHRHSHAGAGIRHLIRGALRVETAGEDTIIATGESWYEPAGTPVRAVALHSRGVTSFVRAMVIPAAYEGKSTFALADAADAKLPRLQTTHRHIDLPLQRDAG